MPARVRALGVSNFGLEELSELVELAHIRPAVVQANSDIFDANALIQAFCQLAGIKFQVGYCTDNLVLELKGSFRTLQASSFAGLLPYCTVLNRAILTLL